MLHISIFSIDFFKRKSTQPLHDYSGTAAFLQEIRTGNVFWVAKKNSRRQKYLENPCLKINLLIAPGPLSNCTWIDNCLLVALKIVWRAQDDMTYWVNLFQQTSEGISTLVTSHQGTVPNLRILCNRCWPLQSTTETNGCSRTCVEICWHFTGDVYNYKHRENCDWGQRASCKCRCNFFANALLSFSQETQRDTFIENCLLCIFWTFMIVLCIKILSFKLCLYKEKT